ncbi:unnamed protein product [Trichobilharzia szidati]|nr:unnamed protein product [Trichobilharzia szidati]
MFSLLSSISSSLLPLLILLTTCCEFKCFGHKFNLHCQQISDNHILLNWTSPRFYSRTPIFMREKISDTQSRDHELKHTQSSLMINTSDKCKFYEFEYISVERKNVLSFANCKCHYMPAMFENIRFRLKQSNKLQMTWNRRKNACNNHFNTLIFQVSKTRNVIKMLGNKNKIKLNVNGKKYNEVILFPHNPLISTENQIGSFGMPTRITFRKPELFLATKIYRGIKIRKLAGNMILLTWKLSKIASKKPYFMVILRGSSTSSLRMSVIGSRGNTFKPLNVPFKQKYRITIYQYLDGMPDWPTVITIRNPCAKCKLNVKIDQLQWKKENADNQLIFYGK